MPKVKKKTRKPQKRKTRSSKKKSNPILGMVSYLLTIIIKIISYPPILTLLVIFSIASWFYLGGYYHKIIKTVTNVSSDLHDQSDLILKDIYLEGKENTTDQDIVNALQIKLGTAMTHIDIHDIKKRIEDIPWVQYAMVERLYPSTLSIRIVERIPAALWQNNHQVELLDGSGFVIEKANLKPYSDLLMVVGDDAPEHLNELILLLEQNSHISSHISSAIRISNRRWNLRLRSGTEIKLPEEQPSIALNRLTSQYKDYKILNNHIKTVDLRIKDKIFVE